MDVVNKKARYQPNLLNKFKQCLDEREEWDVNCQREREIFHLGLEFDDVQVSSILRWIYFGRCMAMEGLLDGKRSVWHLCKFRKIFCLIFNVSDYRIWPYINNFCLKISKIIVGPHFICLYLKLREITFFHLKLYRKLHFAPKKKKKTLNWS